MEAAAQAAKLTCQWHQKKPFATTKVQWGETISGRDPWTSLCPRILQDPCKKDLHGCQSAAGHWEAFVYYQLLQNLIKLDVHVFSHDRWKSSTQEHLHLQNRAPDPPIWAQQESMFKSLIYSAKRCMYIFLYLLIKYVTTTIMFKDNILQNITAYFLAKS